jgi:tRNA-dihydrouridine synthase 2
MDRDDWQIEVAKRLEQAGAVAIGLHARQKHERPVDKAHWDQFAPVAAALSVPILANGDIFVREDLDKLREQSGISSFLIARGALANPSIFRREGMLPAQDVVVDYLKVSAETDNVFQNTKYTVSRMIPCKTDADASCAVTVAELYSIKDGAQMYALWDLQNFYKQHQDAFRAKAAALQVNREGVNAPPLQSEQLPASLMEMEASDAPKKQFYCDVCKLQLLSDQDIALHSKGKKHKKTVRRMKAATFSEYISRAAALQPEAIPVSDDGVKRKEEEEEETANTTGQEHENPAGDDRAPKRAKVE